MDINEQGGHYLRLKQESRQIQTEIAGIHAALKETGKCFGANAQLIGKDPSLWDIDIEIFVEDAKRASKNADRYRELLGQSADNQAAIARFEIL